LIIVKLVIIIPALNEEASIQSVIKSIPENLPGFDQVQSIVVDDGSTDRTAELAQAAGAKVVSHGQNRGVGAAFSTGIQAALTAGADLIVNMDGDGQFDPQTIPGLVQPILDVQADFVTCTRFADKKNIPSMPWVKRYGNRMVAGIINILTGGHFTDVSCGFRAYTRETALRLNLFGEFTYTQESFLDLVQKRVIIKEVPLLVRGEREFGKSRVASSIPRYALRAGSIILLALRDMRPLTFFGLPGFIAIILGLIAGGFVLGHWLATGQTTPYQSLITLSAVLLIIGFLLGILALIADMLGRIRSNQEQILYLQKKKIWNNR
jgi:glycosyltransferase involved in cell wall biosynthesis